MPDHQKEYFEITEEQFQEILKKTSRKQRKQFSNKRPPRKGRKD